jgi:hypothetical protein
MGFEPSNRLTFHVSRALFYVAEFRVYVRVCGLYKEEENTTGQHLPCSRGAGV